MDLYFIAPDPGGSSILIVYEYFASGVFVDYNFIVLVPTAGQTFEDLRQLAIASATAYSTLHSYTVTNQQRYYPSPVTTSVEGIMSATDKTKLDGIATGATANDTDANLKNRANHTGTQSVSTITGLATVATTGAYNDLTGKPSIPAAQIQSDWTQASSGSLDFIKNKPPIPSVTRTTSSLSLSLVGTGATGTQIDASKDSSIKVNVSTSTTSTIGGPSTSLVTLKKCATNSSTEGDWTSVAVLENDQTITLAIVLNSVQVMKGQLCADIPAGWYCKLVNSGSGTHSEAFISGEKTIYG